MPTIHSWGGIGDTLRNLSLIPHELIWRLSGMRSRVVHTPFRELNCLESALPPAPGQVRELIDRCPSLRWAGVGAPTRAAKILNRGLRELIRLLTPGRDRLFPFTIRLSPGELASLPESSGEVRRIGLQTHLLGMRSKCWPVDRWRHVVEALLEIPDVQIHLLEPSEAASELLISPRVIDEGRYGIARNIHLVRRMDLVISVDSWVKYIAAWDAIPQAIVVPDQHSDYPQLTPESMIRHEFAGLWWRPEVRLLGLRVEPGGPVFTFGTMDGLDPDEILRAARQLLN